MTCKIYDERTLFQSPQLYDQKSKPGNDKKFPSMKELFVRPTIDVENQRKLN